MANILNINHPSFTQMNWKVRQSLMDFLSGCRPLIFTGEKSRMKISRMRTELLEDSKYGK